jgi:hypothetical protein
LGKVSTDSIAYFVKRTEKPATLNLFDQDAAVRRSEHINEH